MINAKKKGNIGQVKFADFLLKHGINGRSDKSRSGGGIWKGDVHNDADLTIEVKTVNKLNLMEAWRQVNRDASMARNMPVLATHFDHMPEGEWLVTIHSNDFIEMLKSDMAAKGSKMPSGASSPRISREVVYAIENLVRAGKVAKKAIEDANLLP